MTNPHAELHARRASSFGAHAAAYAEHRPDYPDAAIDWVLDKGMETVVDLGAGTGKLTQSLVSRGLRVIAVEPDAEMLAELTRRFPEAEALPGKAEEIPLPDGSVDAVLVAQAFHWFDVTKALDEIGRILRPGGMLGMFWNYENPDVPWVAKYETLVRTGVSRQTSQNPLPNGHPLFGPFEQDTFDHTFRRTAESLVATVSTHSHMLVATEDDRSAALDRLLTYLKEQPETANGEFDLPLRTITVRVRRRRS